MSNVTLIKNYCYALVIALLLLPTGCDEDEKPENQTQSYSSDVVKSWLDVQVSMLFSQTGNPFGLTHRATWRLWRCPVRIGSAGNACVPDIARTAYGYASNAGHRTGQHYHWPASANAALAAMTQNFFSTDYSLQRTGCFRFGNSIK